MRTRMFAHPLVVRLLAVVLAVAGAGAFAGRAPQALRAFTDTAAEVAPTAGRNGRARHAPAARAASPTAPAPARPASADRPDPAPPLHLAHAWPTAGDLRHLLALKQSRLI